jgi:hypothetical protein
MPFIQAVRRLLPTPLRRLVLRQLTLRCRVGRRAGRATRPIRLLRAGHR